LFGLAGIENKRKSLGSESINRIGTRQFGCSATGLTLTAKHGADGNFRFQFY
jgi:hypothetical protein